MLKEFRLCFVFYIHVSSFSLLTDVSSRFFCLAHLVSADSFFVLESYFCHLFTLLHSNPFKNAE